MDAIVLKPKMSEKTYAISENGVYVFEVDKSINKQQIAKSVEQTFEVTVTSVRTVTTKGKKKRLYRQRRYETGSRSTYKKAYVTLKKGDQIPIFAAIEEAEEQVAKAEAKTDKKAEKAAKKEAKKVSKEK